VPFDPTPQVIRQYECLATPFARRQCAIADSLVDCSPPCPRDRAGFGNAVSKWRIHLKPRRLLRGSPGNRMRLCEHAGKAEYESDVRDHSPTLAAGVRD
jgi:hypothetical protein